MGEGIRAARVVALLKKPGDRVARRGALRSRDRQGGLPVESAFVGVGRVDGGRSTTWWRSGSEIGRASAERKAAGSPRQLRRPAQLAAIAAAAVFRARAAPAGAPAAPALSPAITRRLTSVVPANMQLDAPWDAIRDAREVAKRPRGNSPSPSAMMAWCRERAMEQHAAFRRHGKDGSIVGAGGVRSRHRRRARRRPAGDGGDSSCGAGSIGRSSRGYSTSAIDRERAAGKVEDVQAPLNITSLGAFGVEVRDTDRGAALVYGDALCRSGA